MVWRIKPLRRGERLGKAVEKILGNSAIWAFRKPYLALAIALTISVGLGSGILRVVINADLAQLLPPSFASVRALHALEDHYGAIGYVTILGENSEPEQLRQFARDVATKLEQQGDFRYIDFERPSDFFERHALYFLNMADLEELLGKLEERQAYEKRRRNPLYVDLEDEPPPSIGLDELRERYSRRGVSTAWMTAQLGESYYLDPQKRMVAVLAKPLMPGLDLKASQHVIERTAATIGAMDLSRYGPAFTYEIAGTYKKLVDQQALVERDLGWSNLASLVLLLVFLGFHFRRASAIALVMVPLLVGTSWTYGFAGWSFGTLNILTSFVGAILSGMGIENGIHLLSRFETEWWLSSDREANIRRTFGNTGRGVAITVLTTIVAFVGIGLSRFRAFHELGVIAAVGMFLFMVAYQLMLPALIGLALRHGWAPRTVRHDEPQGYIRWLQRHAPLVFVGAMMVTLALCSGLPSLRFNYDLRSLLASQLRSYQLDHEIETLVGYSQTPVVMLTASRADEELTVAELRARATARGGASTVRFVASSGDLIPANQDEKRRLIQRMAAVLERIDRDALDGSQRHDYDRAMTMVHATPFERVDLPIEVRRQFQGLDEERDSGFVLVYATQDLSDGAFNRVFAREIRGIRAVDGSEVQAAGESMLLADIAEALATEAAPVLAFSIGLVFLALWFFIGSLRSAVICIGLAGCSLLATLGCMPIAGMSLNYINVIMVPMFFGIGIDGGAHLTSRIDAGEPFAPVFSETGRAVAGSLLTNALGFFALVLADHSGLRSLGKMALLGLALNLLVSNVVLPSFIAWRSARGAKTANRRAPQGATAWRSPMR